MSDTERLMKLKREEQLRKMKEWDEICPNEFVDAEITENMTGKAKPRELNQQFAGSGSSLEDVL